jgi:hypothetical protein
MQTGRRAGLRATKPFIILGAACYLAFRPADLAYIVIIALILPGGMNFSYAPPDHAGVWLRCPESPA